VGDFNGDGKQDLAVATGILLGHGTGSFSAPINFDAGDNPHSVAVGDFNGDGKQDLAVATEPEPTYNYGKLAILLGNGDGTVSAPSYFDAGNTSDSVAVGDFNGDGRQDLAVANRVSHDVSIFLRHCQVSQITPAGTTCSQFSSDTAETLSSLQYIVLGNDIHDVRPNFLYWMKVTAPAGNNTLRITQTITTGNFNTFFAAIGHGSNVFDSNCVSLERSGSQIGNTVQVKFNAPAAGTYFIAIAFNAQSLVGQPAPGPTTVHYDFTTTGVPDSTSGLDLLKH
jgi:hypothetical protein